MADVVKTFTTAENWLKSNGYIPVSPLKNGLPSSASYNEHMLRDLQLLSECDEIYMLHGWEQSKGCRIEFAEAVTLKKPIKFQQRCENTDI